MLIMALFIPIQIFCLLLFSKEFCLAVDEPSNDDNEKGNSKNPMTIDEKTSHQHESSSMHGHPDLEFRLGPSNSSTLSSSLSLPQQGQQHGQSSHQSHPISPIPQSKIQHATQLLQNAFTPVDLEFSLSRQHKPKSPTHDQSHPDLELHLGSPSNPSQQKKAKIPEKGKDSMPSQTETTFTHYDRQSPDLGLHLSLRPQLSNNPSKKPSTSLSLQIPPHNPLELELATLRHDDSSYRLHGIEQIPPSGMHHPQEPNVQGNLHQHHSVANPAQKYKSPTHDQSNPDLEFHLGSSGHAKQKMAQKGKDQMPASQTETTSTYHGQQSHDLGFHLSLPSVDSSNPKSSNNPSKKPLRPSPLQIPLPDPLELAKKFRGIHQQNANLSGQKDGTEQIQPRNPPQEPIVPGNIHQHHSGTKSTSNTQKASSSGLQFKFQLSDFPPTNTPKASSSGHQQLHFIPSDFFPTDTQENQTQHSEHSGINPHNKSVQQSGPSSSQAANPRPPMPSPGQRLFQRQHSEILLNALKRQFSNKSYESVGSSKIDQNVHPINSQPSQIPGTSEQRPPQYLRQNSNLSVSNDFSHHSQKIRRPADLSNNVKENFPSISNFLNEMERKYNEDKPDTKKYEKLLESVKIPISQEIEHQIDPLVPSASAQQEQLNSQPSQIPAGTSGQPQRPYLRQHSDIVQSSNQLPGSGQQKQIQPSRMSRSKKPMQVENPSQQQQESPSLQDHQSTAGGLIRWRPSGTSNSPTKDENAERKQLLDSMEQQPLPPNLQMNAEEEKSDDEQIMLGLMSGQKRGPNDEKDGEDKDEECPSSGQKVTKIAKKN